MNNKRLARIVDALEQKAQRRKKGLTFSETWAMTILPPKEPEHEESDAKHDEPDKPDGK